MVVTLLYSLSEFSTKQVYREKCLQEQQILGKTHRKESGGLLSARAAVETQVPREMTLHLLRVLWNFLCLWAGPVASSTGMRENRRSNL